MIAISNLKLRPGEPETLLRKKAARALGIDPGGIETLTIRKKSLDARRKPALWWVYTVGVTVAGDEGALAKRCKTASVVQYVPYHIPQV